MYTNITIKFFSIFILFFAICPKALSIESKIVVKIDNKIVTNIDINNEANYLKVLNPKLKRLDKNKIFTVAKMSLIREKIKEIEILKFNQKEIENEYLEGVVRSIYTNIGLNNKDEFLNYIGLSGIDISTIEKKLKIEALWNQLIVNKFFSKLKINKDEIKKNILTNNKKSISYLLYEIVYNAKKNSQKNEIFEEIKKSINENGFENTASIYSISDSSKTGGKIGWINENSVTKEIFKEIVNLKINNYSNPILIPGGFLILFVKDKKEVKKEIDVEKELKSRIRNLQNQQLNQYSNIYFDKIKKDTTINEK